MSDSVVASRKDPMMTINELIAHYNDLVAYPQVVEPGGWRLPSYATA